MSMLRSFVTVSHLALQRLLAALPSNLRHLWCALALHALAALAFDCLHGAPQQWRVLLAAILLGSFVVWVVPLARRTVLVKVGELIVIAGAAMTIALAGGLVADLLSHLLTGCGLVATCTSG